MFGLMHEAADIMDSLHRQTQLLCDEIIFHAVFDPVKHQVQRLAWQTENINILVTYTRDDIWIRSPVQYLSRYTNEPG